MSHQLSKGNHVGKYIREAKIGQGTYGKVFKGHHRHTGEQVALKRIWMDHADKGTADTAWREVKMLKKLQHENVVNLIKFLRTIEDKESKGYRRYFYLVLEFCQHDLDSLICNDNLKFSLGEIKNVMQQMFEGLFYIHSKKIVHCDMKPANILVTNDGIVKVADFGLACNYNTNKRDGQDNCYSNNVISLWYRPPELLLGERNYGPSVDMWSAGCILAEMWTRCPILTGDSEQDQLILISELCGSISPESWPAVKELGLYKFWKLPKKQKCNMQELLGDIVECPEALDMLKDLLTLDPSKRIESNDAVLHDFFCKNPMPCSLDEMLSIHNHFKQSTN